MGNNYDANSIQHLETREAIRSRVPMYLGSDDTEGIYQALKEIINNSTDEALVGYGNKIEIIFNSANNTIKCIDEGRGCPIGMKDGRNVLVAIFTESHTGGKFDKDSYKNSSGLNGIGATAVCMSSSRFEVTSSRDGVFATASFEEGVLKDYKEEKWNKPNTPTGTSVTFQPDPKVFINMTEGYSFERICNEIKNISYLNKGVHFILKEIQTGETKEYYSENGIADFIKDKVKKPLMKNPIIISKSDGTDEVEVAFMWTGDSESSYVFVNGLLCPEGGSPITAAKRTLTTSIKRLSKKDFEPELIRKGLVYAINCKVLNPSFANQTKSKINSQSLAPLTSAAFKEGLEQFSKSPDFSVIIDLMCRYQKAENAAERARTAVLEHNREMNKLKKEKLAFINKLSDAEILGQDSILTIVEGDSAGSSVAMGRDTKKYGILKIRGKMKNGLKSEDEEFLKNEEIKLLLYALGIDINNYNPNKLRYGKIAICVDSDDDGYHIALLIMANLQRLCPEFLKENRLLWLRSPLYIEIDKSNNPISWYYTDKEFDKARPRIHGDVKRIKGLGALSEKDLKATMFSTTGGQRLDEIEYSEEGIKELCDLMGIDIAPRKEFVFNKINFENYGEV